MVEITIQNKKGVKRESLNKISALTALVREREREREREIERDSAVT